MRRRILIQNDNYLKVLPEEVVWVSQEISSDYNVYSNTRWKID